MGFFSNMGRRMRALTSSGAITAAAPGYTQTGGSLASLGAFNDVSDSWQNQAIDFYDIVPELRSGINWQGAAASRATLYAGIVPDNRQQVPAPIPNRNHAAVALLDELASTNADQAQLINAMAINTRLIGQWYLLGRDIDGRRVWRVASIKEVDRRAEGTFIREGARWVPLDPVTSTLIPVWWPSPIDYNRPDAPTKALLSTLQELVDLSAHVQATTRSRLAGAGVLLMPNGLNVAAPGTTTGINPVNADPIMAELMTAMSAALKNRRDASALVPIFLKGNPEALDKIRHLTFSTPFDERLSELRNAAVRRIATGLDIPPEILTGMSGGSDGSSLNHWTAWQVAEDAIKLAVVPLLSFICDALTERYLRPALRALNIPNPERYQVWFDITALTLRPNRGPEALEAYRLGAISAAALRKSLGFESDDADPAGTPPATAAPGTAPAAPNERPARPERIAARIDRDAPAGARGVGTNNVGPASGRETKPITASASEKPPEPKTNGVHINGMNGAHAKASGFVSATSDSGGQVILSAATPDAAWMRKCADIAARRALTRAGTWVLNSNPRRVRGEFRDIPNEEIHTKLPVGQHNLDAALDGAYREISEVAPELIGPVDIYVRRLLVSGVRHDAKNLADYLGGQPCP